MQTEVVKNHTKKAVHHTDRLLSEISKLILF